VKFDFRVHLMAIILTAMIFTAAKRAKQENMKKNMTIPEKTVGER